MSKYLVFALTALLARISLAEWRFWDEPRSSVYFNVNGVQEGYSLWSGGVGNFQNHDFGAFQLTDTFLLFEYGTRAWEDNGSDVTGAEYFYTIYSGERPASPVFTSLGNSWLFVEGIPYQVWGVTSLYGIADLLDGLSVDTTYTLEMFGQLTGTDDGDPANNYNIYDDNSGNNFTATFQTISVPEPASMSLLALGALTMSLRRNKRK